MKDRLEMFETMIAKGSVDPFVWYARAMELRSRERFDDAMAAYGEVSAKFPDYVPTYLMAAQVCEQQGNNDDARSWAERGLKVAEKTDPHAASELQAFLDEL